MASPTKPPTHLGLKKTTNESKLSQVDKTRHGSAESDEEAADQDRGDAPVQKREAGDDAVAKREEFEEASAVVARHVKLLRDYNEIKDVGQQLMGLVAENRGVSVGSLYATGEFGVGPKD